jgi:hypothetical protein
MAQETNQAGRAAAKPKPATLGSPLAVARFALLFAPLLALLLPLGNLEIWLDGEFNDTLNLIGILKGLRQLRSILAVPDLQARQWFSLSAIGLGVVAAAALAAPVACVLAGSRFWFPVNVAIAAVGLCGATVYTYAFARFCSQIPFMYYGTANAASSIGVLGIFLAFAGILAVSAASKLRRREPTKKAAAKPNQSKRSAP